MDIPEPSVGDDRVPLRELLSLCLALGLVGVLVVVADPQRVWAILTDSNGVLYLVAGVVFMGNYLPAVVRWQVLQREVGYDPGGMATFEILAVTYGMNQLLPANAGDLVRTKITERYYPVESHTELAGIVLVERLIDGTVLLVLLLVAVSVLSLSVPHVEAIVLIVVIVLGTASAVIVLVDRIHLPIPECIPPFLSNAIDSFVRAIHGVSPVSLLIAFVLACARWLIVALAFLLVSSTVGYPISFPLAVALTTGMSIPSIAPLTPGGVGPGDAIGVAILLAGGIPYSVSVAMTLLHRSFGPLWMAPLGVAFYVARIE